MSKFHSAVSRREFMKVLGLTGIGAAALTTPTFHDLDELANSGKSVRQLPWFTKERDYENLAVEIDWDKKERYDKGKFTSVLAAEAEKRVQTQLENIKGLGTKANTGMTHKDYAFFAGSASGAVSAVTPLIKGDTTLMYTSGGTTKPAGYTWQDLGLPRHSASAEENLKIMTAALRFWGAVDVGAHEVNSKTQKVFYKCDAKGLPYTFADVDNAYTDKSNACVIPNKAKTVLTWVVPMSRLGAYSAPDGFNILNKVSMAIGYSQGDIIQARILTMLGALNYLSIGRSCGGMNVAHGELAGNGEHGRTDYLLNSSYGANVRYSDFALTDLPIEFTKPIDQGMWRFCQTCAKCATMCPSGAIGKEVKAPTYDITHPESNGYGLKAYHVDYAKCHPYRGNPGSVIPGGCGICQTVCVFSKMDSSMVHPVIQGVAGTTDLFNGFFRKMDDAFGYGVFKQPDDFWNKDGIDDINNPAFRPWGRSNSRP